MKKTITLLSIAACGIITSHAQITITPNDVVLAGKMIYQANDTVSPLTIGAINPGPAGANKTWTFSGLQSSTVDTISITNPAWLPNGSKFPTSNLAMLFNDGTEYYLKNNATGLYAMGAAGGMAPGVITFTPNEEITSFDNTYNSTFQNTSKFSVKDSFTQFAGGDSIKVIETKYKDVKTDGWGSITTPLGTYNALRQRGKVVTTDSIFLHIAVLNQWQYITDMVDTNYHFAWWTNGVGLPLLEFDSLGGDTISGVTWLKALPLVGGVHENTAFNGVNAYPNPSSGKFVLSMPTTLTDGVADVYTALGEKLFTTQFKSGKEGAVDLSAQPNGIYYLQIRSQEGVATRKLVVSK